MVLSPAQTLITNTEHIDRTSNLPIKKFVPLKTAVLSETIAITVITITAIRLLVNYGVTDVNWLIIPGILMTAAIAVSLIRRRNLRHTGLNLNNIRLSLRLLFWSSILILPSVFLFLWLISSFGLNLPLQPVAPQQGRWIHWLVFQFLYVAFAEEVFFRGFVQSNLLILSRNLIKIQHRYQKYVTVVLSAICFAAAHVVILSSFSCILTFFPGLIFGWLFLRTRSLLAPVLFHGLANTCYCIICIVLM